MSAVMTRLMATLSPRLLRAAGYPVGVHLSGDRLSAAQIQRTAGWARPSAVASLDLGCPWYSMLGEPRRFKHALQRLWTEHGFRGREVIAAMPQEQLKVFTVDYTVAPGQADAEAISSEVKDRMKDKARGLVVDFVPVRQATPDERSKEAVVAVAAREDVTAFLEFLRHAGLEVSALDITGMALKRVVPWIDRGSTPHLQNALLIHFGALSSQLTVIWGRRLMLDRSIEFSEQRLISRVVRLLDVPEPAAKRLLAEHGLATRKGAGTEMDGVLREIVGARARPAQSRSRQDAALRGLQNPRQRHRQRASGGGGCALSRRGATAEQGPGRAGGSARPAVCLCAFADRRTGGRAVAAMRRRRGGRPGVARRAGARRMSEFNLIPADYAREQVLRRRLRRASAGLLVLCCLVLLARSALGLLVSGERNYLAQLQSKRQLWQESKAKTEQYTREALVAEKQLLALNELRRREHLRLFLEALDTAYVDKVWFDEIKYYRRESLPAGAPAGAPGRARGAAHRDDRPCHEPHHARGVHAQAGKRSRRSPSSRCSIPARALIREA